MWVALSCAAPDSAVARLTENGDRTWTIDTHLNAAVLDVANLLMWSKTKDAERGSNKPHPVPRPGDDPDANKAKGDGTTETFGETTTPAALEELFADFYG